MELLSEEKPKNVFANILQNNLNAEEQTTLSAWEMFQAKMYEDSVGTEVLQGHLQKFMVQLKKEQKNQARLQAAGKINLNL